MPESNEFPARHPAMSPHPVYPCDICGREYLDYASMRKHRLLCKQERDSCDRAGVKLDPDKYIQGKYGHLVCRTRADVERIMAMRKQLREGQNGEN